MIGAHVGLVPELQWSDPATWGGLIHGRSAILFALVAGISVALLTGGRVRPEGERLRQARLRMAGRALAILAIGLGLEAIGTSILVILPMYGFLFLVLLPFLGWRRRSLVIAAAVVAVVGPVVSFSLQAMTQSSGSGANLAVLVWGTYPLATWLPLLFLGMALGRSDLTSRRLAAGLIAAGAAVSALSYAGSVALGSSMDAAANFASSADSSATGAASTKPIPGAEMDLTGMTCTREGIGFVSCYDEEVLADEAASASESSGEWGSGYIASWRAAGGFAHLRDSIVASGPHTGGIFEVLGAGGLVAAVIGACLLLANRLRWLLLPVAAVGTMPLTAYSLHVVSVGLLITPLNLSGSWFPLAGGPQTNLFWLICVLTLMAVCSLWAIVWGQGPLERVAAWAGRSLEAPRPAAKGQATN